jgi:hypothetical protein
LLLGGLDLVTQVTSGTSGDQEPWLNVGKALPTVRTEPPAQTVIDWFRSINHHDYPLALAHFVPLDRQLMHWSDFGSTSFGDVHCDLLWQHLTDAQVGCSFFVPDPSPDMEGIDGWGVTLARHRQGPWLITGYGQG